MNLLFTFDVNYLDPFCCTLKSVLFHLPVSIREQVHLYLVFHHFQKNPEGVKYLENFFQQHQLTSEQWTWVKFDHKKIKSFPIRKRDHVSLSTYIRLFMTEFLPIELDRVLYLDCDLIIREDITPLWETEFPEDSSYLLAAVDGGRENTLEYYNYFLKFKKFKKRIGKENLTNEKFRLFNAGVLLINLVEWRKDPKLINKFLKFIDRNGKHMVYHDQDVLNYFCLKNRWLSLNPKWNRCLSVFFQDPLPPETAIIHYNYFYKPWTYIYPTNEAQDLWNQWWLPLNNKFNQYQLPQIKPKNKQAQNKQIKNEQIKNKQIKNKQIKNKSRRKINKTKTKSKK